MTNTKSTTGVAKHHNYQEYSVRYSQTFDDGEEVLSSDVVIDEDDAKKKILESLQGDVSIDGVAPTKDGNIWVSYTQSYGETERVLATDREGAKKIILERLSGDVHIMSVSPVETEVV